MNPKIDEFGNKYWCNSKEELHREDGPAIEWANGDKSWWINDKRHREDGPACEYIISENSKSHRKNGLVFEKSNIIKFWYLNDQKN